MRKLTITSSNMDKNGDFYQRLAQEDLAEFGINVISKGTHGPDLYCPGLHIKFEVKGSKRYRKPRVRNGHAYNNKGFFYLHFPIPEVDLFIFVIYHGGIHESHYLLPRTIKGFVSKKKQHSNPKRAVYVPFQFVQENGINPEEFFEKKKGEQANLTRYISS